MTNIVTDLIGQGINAASDNPYVAAGLVAAGFVIGIAEWLRRKRKARKK